MDRKERPNYSLYIGLMVCGIGVLVLGSVLGAFVFGRHVQDSGVRDFQRTIGSLSPADYALPDVPDQDNAAHWFEEAARSIHLDGDDRDSLKALETDPDMLSSPGKIAAISSIIEKNRTAFDLAEKGANCSRSTYENDYAAGMKMGRPRPELSEQMLLAELLFSRGLLATDRGDLAAALPSVRALGALAQSLERERVIICPLFGVNIEHRQLFLVRRMLSRSDLDARSCRALANDLASTDLGEAYMLALGWDGASVSQIWEQAFEDNLVRARQKGRFVVPVGTPLLRGYMKGSALRGMVRMAQAFRLTYPDMVRGMTEGPGRPSALEHKLSFGFADPYLTAAGPVKMMMSVRQLARVALEVRARGLETGAYPVELAGIEGGADRDAFSGALMEATARADGSLVLTFPMEGTTWRRICTHCPPGWPGLETVLPPLGRASARRGTGS